MVVGGLYPSEPCRLIYHGGKAEIGTSAAISIESLA
jgi:hypothetical protein